MKRSHLEEFKALCWQVMFNRGLRTLQKCWNRLLPFKQRHNLIGWSVPRYWHFRTFFSTNYLLLFFFNWHFLLSEWKNSAHSYQNTFQIEFIAHLKINIRWHNTHFSPVKRKLKQKKVLTKKFSTTFYFPIKQPLICRNASLKLHSFIKPPKKKH